MKLLIIEAPGKLKKLQPMMKKLRPGEDWQVVASGGHIRDLPAKGQDDSMITTGVRKNYTPVYEILIRAAEPSKRSRPQRNRPVKFTSQPTLIVKVKASAGTSSRYWRSKLQTHYF